MGRSIYSNSMVIVLFVVGKKVLVSCKWIKEVVELKNIGSEYFDVSNVLCFK